MAAATKLDSDFLKLSVASVLQQACAHCTVARPSDPVEYVAGFLRNYIEAEATKKKYRAENLAAEEALKEKEEAAAKAAKEADQSEARAKALEHLRELTEDPNELWNFGVLYAGKLSSLDAAYFAILDAPEEDEMAEEAAEGEEGAEEPPAEEAPPEGEESAVEEGFKYDDKFYKYVAADKDSEWMIGQTLPRRSGVSYALCNEAVPWLDIPNVLYKEGVHFFKGMPKIGAYFAVPVVLSTGEIVGMIAGDTCKYLTGGKMTGSGKALTEDDKQFLRDVAAAIAFAMDAAAAARIKAIADAEAEMEAMETRLAEEAAAVEAAGAAGAEVAAAVEGEEAAPAEGAADLPEEQKALNRENAKLTAIKSLLGDLKLSALAEIKSYPRAPKATYKVIKAVLYILGFKKSDFDEWNKCRKVIEQKLVDQMRAHDATGKRKAAAWKGVRACIKGLKDTEVAKESKAGAVMFKWVLAVKEVSDAAVLARNATKSAAGEEPEADEEEEVDEAPAAEEPSA